MHPDLIAQTATLLTNERIARATARARLADADQVRPAARRRIAQTLAARLWGRFAAAVQAPVKAATGRTAAR
jgi:hypothetical protein